MPMRARIRLSDIDWRHRPVQLARATVAETALWIHPTRAIHVRARV